MSKLITTDNLAKLSAGLDARYKALINESVSDMVGGSIDAAQTSILVEVKKQVDAVKDMLGGKSLVYLTQDEYDALSEEEKNAENIIYNITDSESADHEHENLEFLNKLTTINITIGNKTQVLDFNGNLEFSLEDIGVDNNHEYDEYYTEAEINDIVSNLEALISGKSNEGHDHDGRYYTETEMNELLSKKASKDHDHDEFDTFAIKSEVNSALEGKANKQHDHNEYATILKLEEELVDINEVITNQNTELTAEISKVESMLGGKSLAYLTQAEYDALPEEKKRDENIVYNITDAENTDHKHENLELLDKIATINITIGNKTQVLDFNGNLDFSLEDIGMDNNHEHDKYATKLELEKELESVEASINTVSQNVTTLDATLRGEIGKKADFEHSHDDKYYTKSEVDENISTAIINQNSELTAEINRVENMLGGKSIVYITQADYDALSESEKTNELKTYFITDANDSHNHDDLYYTEDEVNQLLADKSDLNHDHNDKYYTETEINTMLADKANKIHEHKDLATVDSLNDAVSDINAEIAKKSDSTHKHNDDYYNKTEATTNFKNINDAIELMDQEITTLETSLNSKISNAQTAAQNYADQQITALVNSAPEAMNTLGELAQAISDHSTEYEAYVATVSSNIATAKSEAITEAGKLDAALKTQLQAEIDADVKTEKERAEAAESTLQAAINGKAASGHTHDDRYYTETEINGKIDTINNTINTKESTLQAAINGKAPKDHTHNYVTKISIPNSAVGDGYEKIIEVDDTTSGNVHAEAIVSGGGDYGGVGHYIGIIRLSGRNARKIELITLTPNSKGSFEIGYVRNETAAITEVYLKHGSYTGGGNIVVLSEVGCSFIRNVTCTQTMPTGYTQGSMEAFYSTLNKPTLSDIDAAPKTHTHDDRYFTETEANNAFAPKSHNHNDKYYTESEIDTKVSNLESAINGKANSSHGTHVTWATTAPKANGTAAVGTVARVAREDHVHPLQESVSGNAGSANQVNNALKIQLNGGTTEGTNQFVFNGSAVKSVNITPSSIGASATGHNHNNSYYTKSQVDTAIAGVTVDSIQAAPKNHTHNQINSRGNVTAETANNRPAVSGLSMSYAYNNGYPTNYGNVMTMKGNGDGQLLIGWSGTSGAHAPAYIRSRRDTSDANWSDWAQIYTTANKPSCNDIGAAPKDNTIATVSVSGGKLALTKDKRQKCTNMASGTQIVFPTVGNTEFLEIHLYFNAESNMNLVLPDCKWRVDPNLEAGKSYELVVTWNTMNWLANLIVYS